MLKLLSCACLLVNLGFIQAQTNTFKICVPHQVFATCQELMSKPADTIALECISGRDRMDCLEKVNQRKADFMAADPEDMYVAYHMSNQDFSVFSEFRTKIESEAEFRYEGIILVPKNSNIKTLADIKGKKACHTGYGRNVGYKIPITKLRKHGILKISSDPDLSPVEKELKGLSELFSEACLVGTYSPNDEINRDLKKRYSNLCARCENPELCNYPDKYSGYDGSIRCVVENGGDLAFTKVIYVRKYFGLPIGNNPAETKASANPADYEYLCEDGSRKPVTGAACSWAQRPWQGYMGNADINNKYKTLQERLQRFYTESRNADKTEAKKLWVSDDQVLVDRKTLLLPGDHLTRAQYKDVIERDGTSEYKLKFCVLSDEEMKKCEVMKRAAYSRDIRPEFECILKAKGACAKAVSDGHADVTVLDVSQFGQTEGLKLKAAVYEKYDDEDVHVVLVDKDLSDDILKKGPLNFDKSDSRSVDAALFFNNKREKNVCPSKLVSAEEAPIKIAKAKDLKGVGDNRQIVCQDLSRKAVTEYKTCNFEFTIPTKVFVRSDITGYLLDNIVHAFISLSNKFGHGAKTEEVFELFGEFEAGEKNVIFSDRAVKFDTIANDISKNDETLYKRLRCE